MSTHTTNITKDSFQEQIERGGILLVDWWASWCGPCRAFAPIYEKAAARHPDVTWGKVDTEAEPELARAFDITAIPTLMVFRDGILVHRQPGMLPASALEQLLDQVQALDMDEIRDRISRAAAAQSRSSGAESLV